MKKVKVDNDTLKEYMILSGLVSQYTERMDEIKAAAKEKGSCSTKDFVVSVQDQSRTSLAGMKEVAAVFGQDELEKHGLVKTTSYQIVKITMKVKAEEIPAAKKAAKTA